MPQGDKVRTMFSGIAHRYDLANHALSFGVDYYWRWKLVHAVANRKPQNVADLATGSGDVAFALRRNLPSSTSLVGLDFCRAMLDVAEQKKASNSRFESIRFMQGDCLALPFEDGSFDALTIAFGLRNFENRHQGLCEMRRVLRKDTGYLNILEFTQPLPAFRTLYFFYLKYILPRMARALTGDPHAYDYLAGSIESFPTRDSLALEIKKAGFQNVEHEGLSLAIVALHQAW